MPRSFARIAFAAVTLAAVAYAGALRAEDAKIDHMSFSITVPYKSDITVTSSDGSSWDTILPAKIPLWADIVVDTKRTGYVERAGIFLGACSGSYCGNHPRLAAWAPMDRDWKFHGMFDFDTGKIPVSTNGIAMVSLGDNILRGCDAGLRPDGASMAHSFSVGVELSLSANTRRAASVDFQIPGEGGVIPFDGGDANKRTSFVLKVNCLAFEMAKAPPEPYSVDLIVDPQGDSCPKKTAVTALIRYHQSATARFRFKLDGELSELIEIKARKVGGPHGKPGLPGKGTYLVERLKTYHLDPGQHHFRIELDGGKKSAVKTLRIECPPFKVTSAWLTYDVADKDTCPKKVVEKASFKATRPGKAPFEIKTAGGLVVHSGTAIFERKGMEYVAEVARKNLRLNEFDSDMMALIKNQPDANSGWVRLKVDCLNALSGKLTLQSLGTTSCKAEALVAIHTNGAGELPYELECGPGKSWKRKVRAPDNKIGIDKLRFDVGNNEQVTCALRTRIGGKLTSLDGTSKTFQCHKPNGVSGSDELAPETKPDPKKPDKPGLAVIDTEPPITCAKGKVKNGKCTCASTHKPVEAGENAWRCVKKTAIVDPPKTNTLSVSTATKEITCVKGKVEDGACTCASTQEPVKTGKNAWRCKKIAAADPPKAVAKKKKK